MPRHMLMMWLLAGGATMVGATMAYLATRPALASSTVRMRDAFNRIRSSRPKMMMFASGDRSDRQQQSAVALSSGNAAFDAYRSEVLAKLDQEQREFQAYLINLRHARDREEFNAFLQEARGRNAITITRPASA